MSLQPYSENEHYRPSIQFFQKDGLDYVEKTDGEKKITLIVDRSHLTPNEEHLYHLFKMKCFDHNLNEMMRKHEQYCNDDKKQTLRIIDLAISLNDRMDRVETGQILLKRAFARESARLGLEISPWLLERRLPSRQIMPERVPRLLPPAVLTPKAKVEGSRSRDKEAPGQPVEDPTPRSREMQVSEQPLPDQSRPERVSKLPYQVVPTQEEKAEVSRPPDKKIARQSAEALPRVRDDSVREAERLLPKKTRAAAPTPALLEKFLGFFLSCLNKIKNWFV